MTQTSKERWRTFWATQDIPHHRTETDEHYAQYGAELRLGLGPRPDGDVLELGCGSGALFGALGFDPARYVGVDYSARMLEVFREQHPDVTLIEADAAEFELDQRFDLIFSNGYLQYLDDDEFAASLRQASTMLRPGGRVFHASVPNRACRRGYIAGDPSLSAAAAPSMPTIVRAYALELSGRSSMCKWWSARRLQEIARDAGFDCRFMGSLLYPYRFHVDLEARHP